MHGDFQDENGQEKSAYPDKSGYPRLPVLVESPPKNNGLCPNVR